MDGAPGASTGAVVDDGPVSGPEQARRAVRAMKSAQYNSFDMAVVLLLGLGSFPVGWMVSPLDWLPRGLPCYFPGLGGPSGPC